MFEIAARNNVLDSLPFKDLAAAKLAYKFEDLQSFLNIYYAGCVVLLHEKVLPLLIRTVIGPLALQWLLELLRHGCCAGI